MAFLNAGDRMKRLKAAFMKLAALALPVLLQAWEYARDVVKGWLAPPTPVLPPFTRPPTVWTWLFGLFLVGALTLFSLFYGFFYALTVPYLMPICFAPIGILAVLAIWAAPDLRNPPVRTMEGFFFAAMVGLILWPNYLCFALPGLPWITMQRLTMIPMTIAFLVALSSSPSVRRMVGGVAGEVPIATALFLVFTVWQFVTLPMAGAEFGDALQKTIIQQFTWTAVFFASCYIFQTRGRVEAYIAVLCLLALPMAVLTFLEYRNQNLLWIGHVPSFLKVDEAATAFQAVMRSADKQYRAKATFSTPLGLAEYMALLTPFLLHYATQKYPRFIRFGAAAMVILVFQVIQWTGSRLGNAGMLVSVLLYFIFWALLRYRMNPRDGMAKTLVYLYPVLFCSTIALSFFWRRLHVMIFGGGAAQASSEARKEQLRMFLPKLVHNPVGLGSAQAGKLGFKSSSTTTVDNYFITVGMQYGVIGLVTFYGMLIGLILYSAWILLSRPRKVSREEMFLIPLSVSMAAFMVIKWVFAQADNHPLIFMMMGMVAALVFRVARKAALNPAQATVPARGAALRPVGPAAGVVVASRPRWSTARLGHPDEGGKGAAGARRQALLQSAKPKWLEP